MRCILISIVLVFFSLANISPVQAEPPQLSARAAVLMDAHSGEILFGKEPHKRRAPASTTKIMTALLALESGDLERVVRISKHSAWTEIGSDIGLRPGDELTLNELLKAAMIVSANDAAVAIAEAIGGGEQSFAQLMNQKAVALGAYNTNFVNANGYSKANHYSTAYDLALITRAALANPEFLALVGTREAVIHWRNRPVELPVRNTNRLLWLYPGSIGVKTGTTVAAGECLVAAAKRDGWRLIAVVLGSRQRYEDTIRLLDYGFQNFSHLQILPHQEYDTVPVENGREASVPLLTTGGIEFTCPRSEMANLETKIIPSRSFQAPINLGERLAELVVMYHGQVVGRTDLVAGRAVERRSWLDRLLDWVRPRQG